MTNTTRTPIIVGKDSNFFFTDTIASATFGNEDGYSNMVTAVRGPAVSFYIVNGSGGEIEYSFNGNAIHGRLAASSERFFPNRGIFKIWFRVTGSSSVIHVEGWANSY